MRVLDSEERRWGRVVHKDVVLLQLLDICLNLVHLGLEHLLAGHLANGVQLAMVALLLVVAHQHLPLLLQGGDEFLALILRHQLPLLVKGGLLLDLHLTHKIVLVFNLLLDLGHVFGHLAVVFLLQHILLLGGGKFRGCHHKHLSLHQIVLTSKNILNSVGNDEVFVRNKSMDGFLVALGHSRLGCSSALEFSD